MSSTQSKSIETISDVAEGKTNRATANDSLSSEAESGSAVRQTSLYRVVWRWHFYAGMLIAPFLFIASATGALYVFHNDLGDYFYRNVRFVAPASNRLTVDELWTALKSKVPDIEELDALNMRNDPAKSIEFITHAFPGGHTNPNQMHRIYFVNQYTSELLGTQLMEREFFHVVLDIHRSMFAGVTGRVLIELATCWGIVLILTGIYLWWPRSQGWGTGVLWPRIKGKPYLILRDFHTVVGAYIAVFAVIVLFTGLFVSVIWGTGFTYVSTKMEQSLFEFFAHAKSAAVVDSPSGPQLEPVVVTALQNSNPNDNLYFQLAEKPEQAHKIYVMRDGDTNTVRGLDIDQYTGELVSRTNTDQLEPMVRLLALMVSLHQGKTFGVGSKVVALLTCVALMGLALTGVLLWWIRRPHGTLGLPPRPVGSPIPVWLWGIMGLVGILLPIVGISMIVIMSGDWLIRKFTRA